MDKTLRAGACLDEPRRDPEEAQVALLFDRVCLEDLKKLG